MVSTLTHRERISRLARTGPSVLLAALYVMIVLQKAAHVVNDATSTDSNWSHQLLMVLYSASGAVFFASVGVLMLVRKEPVRRERRLVGWVLPFAVMAAMSALGFFEPQGFGDRVMFIATFFVVTGTGFTIYALRHLGRHFGVVSDVRGLVTTGPYQWVRHPLYAGETLTLIGLAIAVASPLTIGLFIIGLALQVWRAKVEEQALTAAFPAYREYAARTPMLIPLTKFAIPSSESVHTVK